MWTHVYTVHLPERQRHLPSTDERTVACGWGDCQETGTEYAMLAHYENVHKPEAIANAWASPDGTFACRWGACMAKVANAQGRRRQMGEAGVAKKNESFKWENFIRHLLTVHWQSPSRMVLCEICGQMKRKDDYKRRDHLRSCLTRLMDEPSFRGGGREESLSSSSSSPSPS